MLLKQYKINIEFTLDVVEIDETTARENAKKFSNYEEIINDPEADLHLERQKRLLRALLDNQQVLDEYVRHRAANLIGPGQVNHTWLQIALGAFCWKSYH